MNNLRELLAEE